MSKAFFRRHLFQNSSFWTYQEHNSKFECCSEKYELPDGLFCHFLQKHSTELAVLKGFCTAAILLDCPDSFLHDQDFDKDNIFVMMAPSWIFPKQITCAWHPKNETTNLPIKQFKVLQKESL